MSKIKLKAVPENRLGSDSAKTLLARAKREVPDFVKHYAKLEEQMSIGGYSDSTLFNYARAVAKISLYLKKSLLDLDPDEVNAFLFALAKENQASSTYFKHTVYGLRFFYRLYDLEDRALRLPTIKNDRKLPIALFKG
jgi:integrase/recombinase XerD